MVVGDREEKEGRARLCGAGGLPSGPDHPQDEGKPERQSLGRDASRSITLTAEKWQVGQRGSREKELYDDDSDWEVAGLRDAWEESAHKVLSFPQTPSGMLGE